MANVAARPPFAHDIALAREAVSALAFCPNQPLPLHINEST